MSNWIETQYLHLLEDILEQGVKKTDRTGTGTISVFGRQIRHNMRDGFPLLTTKKMAFKTMVTELLWFLRGDTNIKFLVDNGCHIWDGDAYKNWFKKGRTEFEEFADPMFMSEDALGEEKFHKISKEWFIEKIKTDDEFARKWGELGKIYGSQWRSWGKDFKQIPNETGDGIYNITTTGIDQIANLINDLKTNPDSRRLMVNAWNVGELDQMVLPPCHYGFQVYTRELSIEEKWEQYTKSGLNIEINGTSLELKHMESPFYPKSLPQRAISLMFNMRSNDVPLGLPFNIASYALLLEIIGKIVNMVPDELIGNLGDCHIYLNQIEGVKEQLTRKPYKLPKLVHMKTDDFYKSLSNDLSLLTHLDNTDFVVENYQSHPSIKMPLSN
jgi:thymidylate synthase